jgi:CheY-like chemotaxis protein
MSIKENADVVIFVVEDVEEVRDVLAALLQSDGYQVEAARFRSMRDSVCASEASPIDPP